MRVLHLLAVGASMGAGVAAAADCASGDAPPGYVAGGCDGGGSIEVCDRTAAIITCDLDSGGSLAASLYAVSYWGSSSEPYVFYGTNDAGDDYCCMFPEFGTEITKIDIRGQDLLDNLIWLQSDDGTEWLQDPSGTATLELWVDGLSGDDDLRGTKSGQATIDEILRGSTGDDVLRAYRASLLYGGPDEDELFGSAYADLLYGDLGCGTGGNEGEDHVFAGAGNDTITVCGGRDLVCAGLGDDGLTGGSENDILWGGSLLDFDVIDGQGGNDDQCGPSAATLSKECETVLSSAPPEC